MNISVKLLLEQKTLERSEREKILFHQPLEFIVYFEEKYFPADLFTPSKCNMQFRFRHLSVRVYLQKFFFSNGH